MATALLDQPRSRRDSAAPRSPRPPRDRFIDLLRAAAIVTIVCLHWLMPVISYDDGDLSTANALATGGGWAVTWVSQVMPLIFFAGGAAAALSLDARRRDGRGTTAGWVSDRLARLARPAIPLAIAWIPLPHLLIAVGVPVQPVETVSALVGRLLWFLAAYVLLIAVTPALLRLHDRAGGVGIGVVAAGAVAVDIARFGRLDGGSWFSYANTVLVWGAIYLAGVHYGRGHRWRSLPALAFAGAGLLATALAVAVGPYPASMIGMPGSAVSNMNPPTAVLLGVAAIQLGLLMAVRCWLIRWASLPPVAALLAWISHRTMTIYLWHTPALVTVAGIAVIGFGYAMPEPFSAEWRGTLPAWLALLTGTLAVLARLLVRFEHPLFVHRPRPSRSRAAAAAVLTGGGLLVLAVVGFNPAADLWPLTAAGALAMGVGLASGRIGLPAGWAPARQNGRVVA